MADEVSPELPPAGTAASSPAGIPADEADSSSAGAGTEDSAEVPGSGDEAPADDHTGHDQSGGERVRAGGDPDDPFAGLVLDKSFIRAAPVHEAPARTRAAILRHGGSVAAGRADRSRRSARSGWATRFRRRSAAKPPWPRDWKPRRKRWNPLDSQVVGVGLIVAIVAGAGYLVVHRPGGRSSSDATPAAAATTPAATPSADTTTDPGAELVQRHYKRGHCFIWDQDAVMPTMLR
ncbi:conserved hypothetical protein [Frankia canadensis]|uniref:Uncharacterized protein n=1 Tax=Frankia canadensis TaxID=1836972 RepID=A0A2I2KIS5_9ACTN|nr:hypothetical protein [Frankia canadensis]SNQ45571.1 conserved hypothetical protein [Frankia canadensis]SOU52861.1 conserved hypothetical protein [Frankia canadensis]